MIIQSARYDADQSVIANIDGTEWTVPQDEGNRFYRAIKSWVDDGNVIDPFTAVVSSTDIDAERDRRIASGFTFAGSLFQSRAEDRENIMGASTAALAAMMTGAQVGDYRWHGEDSDFQWIDAENNMHSMDAQTMFQFGKEAMSHKQAHIFAARAIKDMQPIPADFATNPIYWP